VPTGRTLHKLARILGDADIRDAARASPQSQAQVFPFRVWRPRPGTEGGGALVSGVLQTANASHFADGRLLQVDTFAAHRLNADGEQYATGHYPVALLIADLDGDADGNPVGFTSWDEVAVRCRKAFPRAFVIRSRSGKVKVLFAIATASRWQPTERLELVLRYLLRDERLIALCDSARSGMTTTFLDRQALDDFMRQAGRVRLAGNLYTLEREAQAWLLEQARVEQAVERPAAPSPLAAMPGLWGGPIPVLWHRRRDAKASAEAVLRAIMQHATAAGRKLRLSQKAIARLTGLSLGTVNSRLRELKERGWLSPDHDVTTKYLAGEQAMSYILADDLCLIIEASGVALPADGTPRPQRELPPAPGKGEWEAYALPAARAFRRIDDLLAHACSLDGIFGKADRLAKFVRAWRRVWRRDEMPTQSYVTGIMLRLSVPHVVSAHVEHELSGLAA
jgi:hypothetical protein